MNTRTFLVIRPSASAIRETTGGMKTSCSGPSQPTLQGACSRDSGAIVSRALAALSSISRGGGSPNDERALRGSSTSRDARLEQPDVVGDDHARDQVP